MNADALRIADPNDSGSQRHRHGQLSSQHWFTSAYIVITLVHLVKSCILTRQRIAVDLWQAG